MPDLQSNTLAIDSLFSRRPFWSNASSGILRVFVFVLLPAPLFRATQGLLLELFMLLAVGATPSVERPFWLRPAAEDWMSVIVCLTMVLLPSAALATAYHSLATRFRVSKHWWITSCCLLSFVAASVFCNVRFSDIAGESRVCLGASPTLLGWHTLQGAAPLLVALWGRQKGQVHFGDNEWSFN